MKVVDVDDVLGQLAADLVRVQASLQKLDALGEDYRWGKTLKRVVFALTSQVARTQRRRALRCYGGQVAETGMLEDGIERR